MDEHFGAIGKMVIFEDLVKDKMSEKMSGQKDEGTQIRIGL